MVKKVENSYGADSIQKLEGLSAIRKRPGMYIGGTGLSALCHVVYEVLDNSADEYLAGFGNKIEIEFGKDSYMTIRDYGRGIPVGTKKNGKDVLEVLLTELHAGGRICPL